MRASRSILLTTTLVLGTASLAACGDSSHDATSKSVSPSIITWSSKNATSDPVTTSPTPSSNSSTSNKNSHQSTATPSSSNTSGASVPIEDPAADTRSSQPRANIKTIPLGGQTITLPAGLSVINADASSARLMRDDSTVVMLSSATGVEALGPLDQRCHEASESLVEATTEHATPKVSVTKKGSTQICSVQVSGTLQGQSTKGQITMYDVLDASGTDYTINVQDFSKNPSSKDADALRDSLLASISAKTG